MKQYNSKHSAVLSTRGFYTILAVCGIIIAVSVWVLWSNAAAPAQSEPLPHTPIITPAEPLPDLTAETPVMAEDDLPALPADDPMAPPEEPEETEATSAPPPEPTVTVTAPVSVRPTAGAVVTPFSGDELLFQPTLGDWRVHAGTDFAAEPGESVLALTDGTVQEVFEDGLFGSCVTISHDADLVTTYRGLSEVRVTAGQAVSAGEALGVCAESVDAEAALGTHLHVEASRAGTPIDVLELLGETGAE